MPIPSCLLQLPPICAALGVQHVVTSPGSRSAALTIAFSEYEGLTTHSVRDERVAGYVALGLAQMLQKPVVVICTSGTAALNLAPAVAEAYFLHVPLIVLTADRPAEWIHQYDGQTIFQDKIFGPHVKKAIQWLPEESEENRWFVHRSFSELAWLSVQAPAGPVHVNVPIREPFYPDPGDYPLPFPNMQPIRGARLQIHLPDAVLEEWLDELWLSEKPLWVVGQQQSRAFSKKVDRLAEYMPVVADSIGQISPQHALCFPDAWAGYVSETMAPEVLISSDKSILSKPLKLFLRKFKAKHHVHVQASSEWVDPFQSLTTWFACAPEHVVDAILDRIDQQGVPQAWGMYHAQWHRLNRIAMDFLNQHAFLPSDASVVKTLLQVIPRDVVVHGGNSMAIRYINLFYGLGIGPRVFSNRGTSGIDGCLSTAVGAAWASPEVQHIALVGDVTFWYDSNALWQNVLPPNLKVILLNNQGGNIFHMIPGPSQQPSFAPFFQTEQHLTAQGLATSFQFDYRITLVEDLGAEDWTHFWQHDGFLVWEILTQPEQNKLAMQSWRSELSARL